MPLVNSVDNCQWMLYGVVSMIAALVVHENFNGEIVERHGQGFGGGGPVSQCHLELQLNHRPSGDVDKIHGQPSS